MPSAIKSSLKHWKNPRYQSIASRILFVLFFLLLSPPLHAARISEVTDISIQERLFRFFLFQDPSLRYALLGSILLGICCGLSGAFLVVRRQALLGDALSHAVLPGIVLGFVWGMTKNPVAIFVGATIAGLLGAGTVQLLNHTTKHKEDASIGFVLAAFFGAGICLLTLVQNFPEGNKSGLDKFMFGQAAALGQSDVILLAIVTCLTAVLVFLLRKEFTIASFDPAFAQSMGLRVQFFHYTLILLLAFAIVSALQAVGVVLVTAMLVIPAASAYLLTDRLGTLLILAAIFGMCAGAMGAFFSFVGQNLPTGPFMVLSAGTIFAFGLFFSPRHGIYTRWRRRRAQSARIQRENTLKSIYHILEDDNFRIVRITAKNLSNRRNESPIETQSRLAALQHHGLAVLNRGTFRLTPEGWQRACEIVRNHRLWELYLANAANFASDHVHDDADKIEHILDGDTIRLLEQSLNHARRDPHGQLIPGAGDMPFAKVPQDSAAP